MDSYDKIYVQYAEAVGEAIGLEWKISNLNTLAEELKGELVSDQGDGGYGTELSAHAAKQISERLESLASESVKIRSDVFNIEDDASSLIWPKNMRSFIIGMLAKARSKNSFSIVDSKNGSGKECHYKIEIQKWHSGQKSLVFTGIVENNVIKTGYFNWV